MTDNNLQRQQSIINLMYKTLGQNFKENFQHKTKFLKIGGDKRYSREKLSTNVTQRLEIFKRKVEKPVDEVNLLKNELLSLRKSFDDLTLKTKTKNLEIGSRQFQIKKCKEDLLYHLRHTSWLQGKKKKLLEQLQDQEEKQQAAETESRCLRKLQSFISGDIIVYKRKDLKQSSNNSHLNWRLNNISHSLMAKEKQIRVFKDKYRRFQGKLLEEWTDHRFSFSKYKSDLDRNYEAQQNRLQRNIKTRNVQCLQASDWADSRVIRMRKMLLALKLMQAMLRGKGALCLSQHAQSCDEFKRIAGNCREENGPHIVVEKFYTLDVSYEQLIRMIQQKKQKINELCKGRVELERQLSLVQQSKQQIEFQEAQLARAKSEFDQQSMEAKVEESGAKAEQVNLVLCKFQWLLSRGESLVERQEDQSAIDFFKALSARLVQLA